MSDFQLFSAILNQHANLYSKKNNKIILRTFILPSTPDFDKPLAPYDGQVALCPSDNALISDATENVTTSTSFGVISIYYKDQDEWRGVNQRSGQPALKGNEADAICRQMGFTEAYPGSAVTINASDYTFKSCL